MNALWTIIMIAGIIAMLLVNPDGAINSMISGANNAVTLALTLLASYALWLGLFKLVEKTGISGFLTKLMRRPVNFLFPGVNDKAKGYLSSNIAANFLGLGNAATPMGINAVCEMDDKNGRATDGMIMLLVLSSTSLQLLPSTVIGLRAAKGSLSPASFLPACICATVLSTIVGITLVKLISFIEKTFVSHKNAEKCTKNKLFNRSEKVPVTDKRKSERAKNKKILRSEKL